MPLNLPRVTATTGHRTLTVADLRALLAAAESAGVPDTAILRGATIPFHVPDMFNTLGGRLQSLALDVHVDEPGAAAPR